MDKVNIRISENAEKAITRLIETGLFADDLSTALFGLGYALKEHLDEAWEIFEIGPNSQNKWNISSIDQDGELRNILNLLIPNNETPYKLAECLINRGLCALGDELTSNGLGAGINRFM